jgi:hypothetical protein
LYRIDLKLKRAPTSQEEIYFENLLKTSGESIFLDKKFLSPQTSSSNSRKELMGFKLTLVKVRTLTIFMQLKIIVLFLVWSPRLLFGQVDFCPRTDGIYLFDNGQDTVVFNDDFPIDSSAMHFQVFPLPGNENNIIGNGDVCRIDGVHCTHISALYFESEGIGYSLNLGVFRDKNLLVRLAKLCIDSKDQLAQLPECAPIISFETRNNGEITFVCNRGYIYPTETFNVIYCSEILACEYAREVNIRTKFVTSHYIANRNYLFIPFTDILQESFNFPDWN